jgi:hypothetical protein
MSYHLIEDVIPATKRIDKKMLKNACKKTPSH